MAMDLALKRPSAPEPACQKRRRISLQEVEDELSSAGLAQPALSLLHGSTLGMKRELEADITDRAEASVAKRFRPCSELLPCEIADAGAGASHSRAIVPFRGAQMCSSGKNYRIAYSNRPDIRALCGRTSTGTIAVNPDGVAFVLTESGIMLAQFPQGWQPRVVLADGRIVEVTVFALDRKGTVYIWSQDGQFVAEMQAARLLQDGSMTEEPPVKLLSMKDAGGCDVKALLHDLVCSPLTPSTNVPDSDTETEWIGDCAMETD